MTPSFHVYGPMPRDCL